MTNLSAMTTFLEEFALHLRGKLTKEQRAIVDALVVVESLRGPQRPPRDLVAQIRGSAISCRLSSIAISTQMDLIADELEKTQ